MATNITFRKELIGSLTDFCQNTKLNLLKDPLVLVDLIVLLARYQEEGVNLNPKVYITNNINSLTTMLPESERIKIDSERATIDGVRQALKKCAPLAISIWNIYINDNGSNIEYGLFKGSSNPISVMIDQVIMTPNEEISVVKVYQIADDCVQILSNNQNGHYVFLNHRQEESPPPIQHLESLIYTITQNVPDKHKDSVKTFLNIILFESLRSSHGCLIAVVNKNKLPKFLSHDGTILEQPVEFTKLISDLKNNKIYASDVESKGLLLKGMLNTDGIIAFDTHARLLGFNFFVKINKEDKTIGGARNRAFESLTRKVGVGLKAVFLQSHDGSTKLEVEQNE